jgi:MinD superfamily P-loop ATPase
MKIAITSGKGGVGKTLVAACLATVLAESQPVCYIDCDVEAPNAHLFLKPGDVKSAGEYLSCIEGFDLKRCTFCGKCAKVCYFNALAVGKKNGMAFPELCRWCGACIAVCPNDALVIGRRNIGTTYSGQSGAIQLHWATLTAGAGGMTVRLIDQLKSRVQNHSWVVLDSPPGTSCSAVHTIQDADIVILVADPTRFGTHDLKLSVRLCRSMAIEPLVLINRVELGDAISLRSWCRANQLQIIAELPDSRQIGTLYSQGILPTHHIQELKQQFINIVQQLKQMPPKRTVGVMPDIMMSWQHSVSADFVPQTPIAESSGSVPEIVVVSGKGGTGKTSLCACFAQLANNAVADCDVDAADMHLLLSPSVLRSDTFYGGRVMRIDPIACTICGKCMEVCRWEAVYRTNNQPQIAERDCEGCGRCVLICPVDAIAVEPTEDGISYWSSTRFGRMSHAMLEPGKENSGKLVTHVRKQAASGCREQNHKGPILLDGSPGTGCPVIASIGGTQAAVVVTEPTVSGLHDLERILELTDHFRLRTGVIINKADLNNAVAQEIKIVTAQRKAVLLGELPYDLAFVQAQQAGRTILEYQPDSNLAQLMKTIWKQVLLLTGQVE